MIAILFCLTTAAATRGFDSQSYDEKISLLKEAVALVHTYTNMTVLDTRDFGDQVHLLVDDMMHEFGVEFDLLMGNLTSNGHLTMVSASSAESMWPMKPLVMARQDSKYDIEQDSGVSYQDSSLEKRRTEFLGYTPRYLLTYPDSKCKSHDFNGRYVFHPGRCIKIGTKCVKSGYLYNPLSYYMHIALYRSNGCDPTRKVMYHWHGPRMYVCYSVRAGNSMWWDWPSFNAP